MVPIVIHIYKHMYDSRFHILLVGFVWRCSACRCRRLNVGRSCELAADNARFLQRQPTLQRPGITYFSRAFVFDGELALLLAVIDVAQLVVKQIGGRRGEPSEEHREQGREAAHRAAEPEHLKLSRETSGESSFNQH